MAPRQWIRLILTYLFIPLVLFACAWDLGWWQAWLFSLLIVGSSLAGRIWAERRHPGLLAERAQFDEAPDVKSWDRILAPLMAVRLRLRRVGPGGPPLRLRSGAHSDRTRAHGV